MTTKQLMTTATLLIGTVALSACASPRDYETTPVAVSTAHGTVTCQLYTQSQVLWDRSINHPEAMSVETADNVCRAEGTRRLNG
jgi:uncharacterized lipoprotein YbaY